MLLSSCSCAEGRFCGFVSYAKAPMFLQLLQLCEAAFSGILLGLDFMTALSILCFAGVHPMLHLVHLVHMHMATLMAKLAGSKCIVFAAGGWMMQLIYLVSKYSL